MQANGVITRTFKESDYDAVVVLWQAAEGVEIAEGDSRADIAGYLKRNPGLSRVAEIEGRLVGAVLCGHDGRRGLIYHLAVAPSHRSQGLGRKLIDECVAGLKACDIQRAILLVAQDNEGGRIFWKSLGFEAIEAEAYGIDII